MIPAALSCDIFCRIVDNFGDIGVTWRLARQLTLEHCVVVRLIVDDLCTFNRIEPAIDVLLRTQFVNGVRVLDWAQAMNIEPADIVIEAFAVNLPLLYIDAIAQKAQPPLWINLEYLSAESWVGEHHLLPSPHPKLSLTKYFFFPGFTPNTGGLIREQKLIAEREAFVSSRHEDKLNVLLFTYGNAAGSALLRALGAGSKPARCTVPEGEFATSLERSLAHKPDLVSKVETETIAFTSQESFDLLLWRHDVLFVRGEDSFVRAQWAAKPFVWQVYPQSEGAHWLKMDAFLSLYCDGLEPDAALAMRELWRAWNAEDDANIESAWRGFIDHLLTLQAHAVVWSGKLARMPDLAANLLSFYKKNTKI
ncbi:MAG: elongation factor P maturation arginine rhamnosyltransferase EarP [Burkholderiales bacterium]|nr:elongation factor P maturation arginine rhamnosyltransferase EarP [Burkholderiales bacterium]